MRTRLQLFLALTICSAPLTGSACEPIFPLTQLLSGSTLAGPLLLTQSLTLLAFAVAIKCIAFVFLERRLPWPQAILTMVLANVLSTIPGLLTAALAGALTLLALPIVFALGMIAERRLRRLSAAGQAGQFTGKGLAFAFTAAFFVSLVMFALAGVALDTRQFAGFWMFKIAFATLAVSLGMAISAVLEEYAIARLVRSTHGQLSFYTSVIRANYITLGVVLLVAAIQILPRRLNAPHFIVSWLHALSSLLGLG